MVSNSAANYKEHVMNDYLMKGPDLLKTMLAVMLKFREEAIGYVGDVSKMYHQILVDPNIHESGILEAKT